MAKPNPIEQILIQAGDYPWLGVLYTGIGAATFGAWDCWYATKPAWGIIPFFAAVLIVFRLVPTVLRSVIKFSQEAVDVWIGRRNLGRIYDSYQWQKVFWMGLGMAGYLLVRKNAKPQSLGLTLGCLVAGGIGLFVYQGIVRKKELSAKRAS